MKHYGVALVALACVAVASCSDPAPPSRTVAASSLLGKTLGEAYQDVNFVPPGNPPGELGVIQYNITPVVTSEKITGLPGPDWVVVASCYTDAPLPGGDGRPSRRIALGAVPPRFGTDAVKARARTGELNRALTECPGTSDTFTVPAL